MPLCCRPATLRIDKPVSKQSFASIMGTMLSTMETTSPVVSNGLMFAMKGQFVIEHLLNFALFGTNAYSTRRAESNMEVTLR